MSGPSGHTRRRLCLFLERSHGGSQRPQGVGRQRLQDPGALLGLQIVLTLPAVVIGLLFKDHLESFFLTRKPPSIF